MNSQDFLLMNLLGAGAFILWYLVSRGGPIKPNRLNMKAPDTAPTVLEPLPGEPLATTTMPAAVVVGAIQSPRAAVPPIKALNVIFNYNGHSWDAYEVLGVPAGASLPIVTAAYQTALKRCAGPESMEFLETAYRAILSRCG